MHDPEPNIAIPPSCLLQPFEETPIVVHPSTIVPDYGFAETFSDEKLGDRERRGRGDKLRRVLRERHINMIAFAGTIGFGLFLGSGQSVASAGPGGAVLAYILIGTVISSVISCLGEMTALMPVNAPVMEFPRRFLDRGVGFAVGWMYWFAYGVMGASQLISVSNAVKFQYDDGRTVLNWTRGQNVDSAVWITLFLIPAVVINLLPVRVYGELEYFIGSLKIAFITLLIVLMFILDLMQPRAAAYYTQPLGTKYWNSPWSFFSHTYRILDDQGNLQRTIQGSVGTFLGVATTLVKVLFSYSGMDILAATAAESTALSDAETMRMGARKISIRVVTLYTLAVLTASFVVPYDHPYLNGAAPSNGAGSIFIIAVVEAGMPAAAHFLNAFFVFSAATCAIGNLYVSSRVLHTMALGDQTGPEWITRRLRHCRAGIPTRAVIASSMLFLIAYMGRSGDPATRVAELGNNAAVSYCIVYIIICASYLSFYQAIQRAKEHRSISGGPAACYDRDHELYPYKSHGQWLKAAYGMVGCAIVLLFNGVPSMLEQPFNVGGFLSAYLGIPVFFLLVLGYKVHRHGLNFRKYGFEKSDDLSNAVQAVSSKRKGRLELESGGWTKENVGLFFTWVWDWMK